MQTAATLDLTQHWVGYASLGIFGFAYALAMLEDVTMLRKSKSMLFASFLIWVLIASVYVSFDLKETPGQAFRASLEGYAELFLFILVSMTYLNAMEQREVFENLRLWLLSKGFGYRKLFWITGFFSFFLSSVCNNLTTALLMGSVVMAMAKENRKFIAPACVNIVVATNAGGSFSPFGDLTTLLVWQSGEVPFTRFFTLFLPSIANFLVPAAIMHFWVPKESPKPAGAPKPLPYGAKGIVFLFGLTIVTAASFDHFLGLPPAAGMMAGLACLSLYFFWLYKVRVEWQGSKAQNPSSAVAAEIEPKPVELIETKAYFDVFHSVSRLEWDTLLFFYGVMTSVAGLSFIGYLKLASQFLYGDLGPTFANVLIGVMSAFIDNATIMYAVLTMNPTLSQGQWLLATLNAGVGGSLLAIGSAAGVGLLGITKGRYTFLDHLKWTPAIALGFAASNALHFWLNARYF